MRPGIVSAMVILTLLILTSGAESATYTYQTFGATNAANVTFAQGINDSGQVTGYTKATLAAANGLNGFLRSSNGSTYTVFSYSGSTNACGINNNGQIVGYTLRGYPTANYHGLIRSADGALSTEINDPSAGTSSNNGTLSTGINNSGQITGYYYVGTGGIHSFVASSPYTSFTAIDYPSASATRAFGINNNGKITGYYRSGAGDHGFIMNTDGSQPVSFDVSDGRAGTTYAQGINDSGLVTGWYMGNADSKYHGFVRSADGLQYSRIDVPSATQTYAFGINNSGQVTGYYTDAAGAHGFIATPVVILPVLVVGPPDSYFQTINQAYDSLSAGSTITMQAQESPVFTGGLNMDNTVNLTLMGGYDGNFDSPPTGMTTIQGELTIDSGSLAVANLAIN